MTELILTENDKFWEGEGLTEDSDEFFEKYKLAIPKDGYGGFSNAEGEDISWCLRTNWEKMARPVGSDDWNDFIWTIVHSDYDPDATFICQGLHFVNAECCLYSTVPFKEGDKDSYCYTYVREGERDE